MAHPTTWLVIVLVLFISSTFVAPVIVEKGKSTQIQWTFTGTEKSVTWYIAAANANQILVSNCSFADTKCTDQMASNYQASVSVSGNDKVATLSITSARTNESNISCSSESGSYLPDLEVYAWPTALVCEQNVTNTYVDYICTVDNIYPPAQTISAKRRERPFQNSDFDISNTHCTPGPYGSGTDGDYTVQCIVRVPMENMLEKSTFYAIISAPVSNVSLVSNAAVNSNNVRTNLVVPEATIPLATCPDGPEVNFDKFAILIGTNATCKCVMMEVGFPPNSAMWLKEDGTVVGVENNADRTSTINIYFNSSEPGHTYTCQPKTTTKSAYYAPNYTPKFFTDFVPVEKRHSTSLQCSFSSETKSVIWRMYYSNGDLLSTCSSLSNTCKDEQPSLYQGFISRSGNNVVSSLNITNASVSGTQFICEADIGPQILHELLVFARPNKPVCTLNLTMNYAAYNCTSSNLYPDFYIGFYRRQLEFTDEDWNAINTNCYLGNYGEGTDGDYTGTCVFQVPIEIMIAETSIYAIMNSAFYNGTAIDGTAVASDDIITNITIPEVAVYMQNCPVGPGVQGESILIGTNATCKCEMKANGFFPGFARWFTQDMRIVGAENMTDMSSTLTISYNSSDPFQMYKCWPIIPFKANGTAVSYIPLFRDTPVPVAKGKPTYLQCSFPSTVTEITWQIFATNNTANLSSCSFVNNSCIDKMPGVYTGSISSSGNNRTIGLNITNVNISDTAFSCLADSRIRFIISQLEVYDPAGPAAEVAVYMQNCPVGPGVQGNSILIGTNATCKCEMKSNGIPPGFARWFTQDMRIVGAENMTDMSSTLTISYNSSEPFQMYKCWPIISSNATGTAVSYIPLFRDTPVPVEKKQPTYLQCSFPSTVTGITWQIFYKSFAFNLSTCSFGDNSCSDEMPSFYTGSISSLGNNRVMRLDIISVSNTDTTFSCVANNGMRFIISQLEVYAWPTKPICVQNLTNTYAEYNCTTSNVYPGIMATLHRREVGVAGMVSRRRRSLVDFSQSDFDLLNETCTVGDYGSGTDGDFLAWCLWRVPMKNMMANSSVFVEMTANINTLSIVNRSASVSDDITTVLSIPAVVVHKENCPVGPGVQGDSILLETNATCKCEMSSLGFPPGFARWYTKDMKIVGTENTTDMSSTLTLSYSSEPFEVFQCWPIIPFKENGVALNYTAFFTTTPILVERGHSINLQCSFPVNVMSIKWLLLSGGPAVELSTCSFVNNACSDKMPTKYKGSILSSTSNRVMGLNITSARVNETKFICVADNKLKSNISKLEVYVWPTKPSCVQSFTGPYVEYKCTTDNVYPGINAVLHIREMNFSQSDFVNTSCTNGNYGSGTEGDIRASCKWTILINKLMINSFVFVEMTAQVFNLSMVNRSAAVSDDITTTLVTPEVVVNKDYCPFGHGVRRGSVLVGTIATCKCEIKSNGFPVGFARWFTKDRNIVGAENKEDKSSTLSFFYSSKEPNQEYECWPMIPFQANTTGVVFKPSFISSSSPSAMTGVQAVVIIMVALSSGIVSHFS